jgi:hypothetical protein
MRTKTIIFRIEEEIGEEIEKIAKEQERSVSKQCIYFIKKGIASQKI